jgi:hypothetical protein
VRHAENAPIPNRSRNCFITGAEQLPNSFWELTSTCGHIPYRPRSLLPRYRGFGTCCSTACRYAPRRGRHPLPHIAMRLASSASDICSRRATLARPRLLMPSPFRGWGGGKRQGDLERGRQGEHWPTRCAGAPQWHPELPHLASPGGRGIIAGRRGVGRGPARRGARGWRGLRCRRRGGIGRRGVGR